MNNNILIYMRDNMNVIAQWISQHLARVSVIEVQFTRDEVAQCSWVV